MLKKVEKNWMTFGKTSKPTQNHILIPTLSQNKKNQEIVLKRLFQIDFKLKNYSDALKWFKALTEGQDKKSKWKKKFKQELIQIYFQLGIDYFTIHSDCNKCLYYFSKCIILQNNSLNMKKMKKIKYEEK